MFLVVFCSRWPLLCANGSRCHLLPPYRITDMRLTWKERHRWCRWWRDRCALCQIPAWTGHVINMAALHQRSQRGHLTCLSPAGHCTSSGQQHALLILAAELSWLSASPVFVLHPSPFDWFKIMVAVCFTHLTDSSGSGWLPTWLCQGFLILTALLTHLVVSDPSAWLSWSSLCSVFCLNHPIVSMSYFTLCGTRWHLFNLYTCPTHLMVIISKSLALHLLFI